MQEHHCKKFRYWHLPDIHNISGLPGSSKAPCHWSLFLLSLPDRLSAFHRQERNVRQWLFCFLLYNQLFPGQKDHLLYLSGKQRFLPKSCGLRQWDRHCRNGWYCQWLYHTGQDQPGPAVFQRQWVSHNRYQWMIKETGNRQYPVFCKRYIQIKEWEAGTGCQGWWIKAGHTALIHQRTEGY